MLSDKTLTCVECRNDFTFSVGEQEFFASRGFTNEPTRCPQCRAARRSQQPGSGGFGGAPRAPREMHPVVCAQCGARGAPTPPHTIAKVYNFPPLTLLFADRRPCQSDFLHCSLVLCPTPPNPCVGFSPPTVCSGNRRSYAVMHELDIICTRLYAVITIFY